MGTTPRVQPGADIDFDAIRDGLGISDVFPQEALDEAERTAQAPPRPGVDRTDLPFVTIDPPGSMDLDQAVHLEKLGDGYRVRYAIADVMAAVPPGGPVDAESWKRGQTLYAPDRSIPLHPPVLSEGVASLLPDQTRAAVLWTIDLNAAGEQIAVQVERATVRSVARLEYRQVQADVDAGSVHPSIALLPEIGRLRIDLARQRHAIELALPDVEVALVDGVWTLVLRAPLPVEDWNAQISLLTGMAAAGIMVEAGIGVLRTLPPADERTVGELRRSAKALGITWPKGLPAGDLIAGLDPADTKVAAFLDDAVHLLRGAGYTPFTGGVLPEHPGHAGVGSIYAHVTAPLRRLADRWATEICLAVTAGQDVPPAVVAALAALPDTMTASGRLAGDLTRAGEAAVRVRLLADRIGDTFTATVLQAERGRDRAFLLLADPPVRVQAKVDSLTEGEVIQVVLDKVSADGGQILVSPLPKPDGRLE